jgi:tetratricopeptide (TPR) repeat protein
LLKLAIEISTSHNGADSVPTAKLLIRSASGLAQKGDHDKAAPIYEKAIAILEKDKNYDRSELADMLQLYSVSLEQLKRTADAKKVLERAKDIRKELAMAK